MRDLHGIDRHMDAHLSTHQIKQKRHTIVIAGTVKNCTVIGKWTVDNTYPLALPDAGSRQNNKAICVLTHLNRLDNRVRDRTRMLSIAQQIVNANGSINGSPLAMFDIHPHKKVAGKKRRPNHLDAACMAPPATVAGKVDGEILRAQLMRGTRLQMRV